jgi:serine/threonine-protein kinase
VASPSILQLRPGALFHERYEVVACLAAGGMGAVYEILDRATAARRALKVILPELLGDAEVRARFAQEARITGGIRSEHLVSVTDAGVDEPSGVPFLVMDLLEGRELGKLVEERGPLPPADVVTYLSQAALALDKTHDAGIVHRDLKPENLFLTRRDDGSPCVKILDFGIAKVILGAGSAKQTRTLGTPLYMAPEQIVAAGPIDRRADLYALAQIAYTLLVGEPFWSEEGEAGTVYWLLTRIAAGSDERASARALRRRGAALSPAFDAWFARAAARDPAGRFARADAACEALARALAAPSAAGLTPAATVGSADPAPRRSRAARALVPALLAAAVLAVVAVYARSPRPAPLPVPVAPERPAVTSPPPAIVPAPSEAPAATAAPTVAPAASSARRLPPRPATPTAASAPPHSAPAPPEGMY